MLVPADIMPLFVVLNGMGRLTTSGTLLAGSGLLPSALPLAIFSNDARSASASGGALLLGDPSFSPYGVGDWNLNPFFFFSFFDFSFFDLGLGSYPTDSFTRLLPFFLSSSSTTVDAMLGDLACPFNVFLAGGLFPRP